MVQAIISKVCNTGSKKLLFFICHYEIIVGQIPGALVNINDKGGYPIIALPEGIDPPADVHLKPSERPITVALKPSGPFARNRYLKIYTWFLYGGIESEPPNTKVFTG